MLRFLKRTFDPAPSAPPALPDGIRVYALSDIHGRADLFQKALEWIAQDAAQHPDKRIIEILLGDFIDRGMQSKQVLELAIAEPAHGHERICLMGNHEATLLDFLHNAQVLRGWMSYGGLPTLDAYGVELPQDMTPNSFETLREQFTAALPETHRAFLQNLQTDYLLGDYYFVHAGVRPNVPLEEQRDEDKCWIREPFLSHKKPFEKYIVHGRTPLPAPQFYPHRVNLDMNEAAEDMLACLILDGTTKHIELIIH